MTRALLPARCFAVHHGVVRTWTTRWQRVANSPNGTRPTSRCTAHPRLKKNVSMAEVAGLGRIRCVIRLGDVWWPTARSGSGRDYQVRASSTSPKVASGLRAMIDNCGRQNRTRFVPGRLRTCAPSRPVRDSRWPGNCCRVRRDPRRRPWSLVRARARSANE